jgi:hypothetical protein
MEEPPVPLPNAIVVSGDLVPGLPLKSADYPAALEKQYSDAFELLAKLADIFVEGDRSKIVIVPGNHDVDWNMAQSAMIATGKLDKSVLELLSYPDSPYRWCWEDQQLYRIDNSNIYEERFKYFNDFYCRFYDGANLAFKPDPKRIWNLFTLDEGKILVCAFNSCTNVDCFEFSGEIPPQAIAQSHLAESGNYRLKIAVWHHDVQGPPKRTDYLDPDTIKLMIDRGYRLGMHGHRHKSDALPFSLHVTPENYRMVVIGAGSLCAGLNQLPHGLNRQYNIVQIHDDCLHARLHVREMNTPSIFSPGRLIAVGGRSYIDLSWDPPPCNALVDTGRGGGPYINLIEHIESLISKGRPDDAIPIIDANMGRLGRYGGQLLSEALFKAKHWERIEQHLSNPQNPDELTKLVLATINLKHWENGKRALVVAKKSGNFPVPLIRDLEERLMAEEDMSQ